MFVEDISSVLNARFAALLSARLNTGFTLKLVSASFQRPGDTTGYTLGDSISNSTSAPTVLELDLATIGAVAGQSVQIHELVICSSLKQALLPLIIAFVSPVTFGIANDNAAFDITDAINEGGAHFFNCDFQSYSASNSRCAYIGTPRPFVLAPGDTKLYAALQANNAYVPGASEMFTLMAWVALL